MSTKQAKRFEIQAIDIPGVAIALTVAYMVTVTLVIVGLVLLGVVHESHFAFIAPLGFAGWVATVVGFISHYYNPKPEGA